MKKLVAISPLVATVLMVVVGLFATLLFCFQPVQADSTLPPFVVQTSAAITVTHIPTPTLPARLHLVAPAFAVRTSAKPIILTLNTASFKGDISRLHLVYRADAQSPWRPLYFSQDGRQAVPIPGSGDYAWVQLLPATVPPAPSGAIVVDDVPPKFITYTYSTPQYWHVAQENGDFYGGHTHWTRNTSATIDMENWAVWQAPISLDGPCTVWVYVPNNYANTEHARYVVYHAGISDTVEIDQNAVYPDAAWISLGIFNFTPGTESYVMLSDVTGEPYDHYYIAFDAVAFVPQIKRVYLPLVLRDWPPMKSRAGIHLGNRDDDWRPPGSPADFLSLLDPIANKDGIYPAAVVILSSYLYNIGRSSTAPCNVETATVRVPTLYAYLRQASQSGTQVVIRIEPSPGNFQDWYTSTQTTHTLIADMAPAGDHYCWSDSWPKSPDKPYGFQYFRSYADIADEMGAIHALNESYGWSEAGFIPANEPNTEWYSERTVPDRNRATAWQAMNAYFVALYDYAHSQYPGVKVFTPAMAQTALAETVHIQTCDPIGVEGYYSGYTLMYDTYYNKNDGYTWNNYYWYGRESWGDCPSGQHVSYFFPLWLQGELDFYTTKPSFIIEMDLAAPQQMSGGSTLVNKDADVNVTTTSLQHFTLSEQRADFVVLWLLTNANNDNEEFNWHKAYEDDGSVRPWFENWWLASME